MPTGVSEGLKDAGANYDARFHRIAIDTAVLKWMVGANIALTLSLVARTFF